jgi:hypothetical protein
VSASAWQSSRASPKHTTEPSPSPPGPTAGSASQFSYPPQHRTHEAFGRKRTVRGQVLGTGTESLRAAQGNSSKRSTKAPKAHRSGTQGGKPPSPAPHRSGPSGNRPVAAPPRPDSYLHGLGLARLQSPQVFRTSHASQCSGLACETGAGGSGTPPGPSTKVSGETAACWPTPGTLQSHTPPGNVACSRANCADEKTAGA